MEYTLVSFTEKETFIRMVNEKISEGWTPLGGVGHAMWQIQTQNGNKVHVQAQSVFSQAMTRRLISN